VKFDIPHRICKVYGRQLSVLGADGNRSTVAVFDYNGRLYQIEAKALPGGGDTAADTLFVLAAPSTPANRPSIFSILPSPAQSGKSRRRDLD